MRCSTVLLLVLFLAAAGSSRCSEEAKPAKSDLGRDSRSPRDRSAVEGPLDALRDLPEDQGRDAATDGARDLVLVDAPRDGAAGDTGTPRLSGTVSRTATPVGDGKGTLYVGLYLPFFPPLYMTGNAIPSVDLSQPGAQVKYAIWGAQPGTYVLFAFLDENQNASLPFMLPDPGDLAMSQPMDLTVGTTPQSIDLVLDKVEGGFSDGGVGEGNTSGGLQGKITSTVSPAPGADGQGTIVVTLHLQVPPAGQVAATVVNKADLSSAYGVESYFLSGVPAGNYYLRVFLDDNNNYNPLGPSLGPDTGDMIHSAPIQVHIVAGAAGVKDVVLDQLQP
jgi:hypothetical protein